jgi:hypothetical protein
MNFQLKYLKGDFYMNIFVQSLTEVPAYAFSGFIYGKYGSKKCLVLCLFIGISGSIPYMIYDTSSNLLNSIMISTAKFGISGSLNVAFLLN